MERFEKLLTKTDIQQKLAVRTGFVTHHDLVDAQELEVIDMDNGRSYRFILSFRGAGDYMKPVFQARGWLDFVRQNHLQVGDTIHFWKEDSQTFGIRVMKDFLSRSDQPK